MAFCYNIFIITIGEVDKLRKENLSLITVVTGKDLGQFSQLKERMMARVGYDKDDLTCSYFDTAEADYRGAEMDLEGPPFFADQKVVISDNLLDITTAKKSYLDGKALKRFEAYLENPLGTTRLIIFAPGKLGGKHRLMRILRRDAQIFEASELKEAELKACFQKLAHKENLTFNSGVFETLLLKSNYDFSKILENIAFLRSYKKDDHITTDDINQTIPKTLQDNIFGLVQFVLNGKIDETRELIRNLHLQDEDEIKLIAIMLGQFRAFLQVNILASQGRNEQRTVAALSDYLGRHVNSYQVEFALRDSRTLSVPFLKKALAVSIEADYAIKTGTYDKAYLSDIAILGVAHEYR